MNFSIAQSTLSKELATLASVVEKKGTIPILSNLHLEANGALKLRGTDLDLWFRSECDLELKVQGALCVNAKKLMDIVKSLDSGEIQFTLGKNDKLQIASSGSKFSMGSLPATDYPESPSDAEAEYVALSGAHLRAMIQRVQFAITTEESRYTLNGARFEMGGGEMRMVATDGHRLAFIEGPSPYNGEKRWEVLIPKKTLAELSKMADGALEVELALAKDGQHLFARAGRRWMASRLLSGQFPNYELVLPKDNEHKAVVEVAALAAAIRRVGLMSDERSHAVQLVIGDEQHPDRLKVMSPANDNGEAESAVSVRYSGPGMTIAFNYEYLTDFLDACPTKDVSIELKSSASQMLLRPHTEEGSAPLASDYRYVVMPMRL